MAYLHSKILDTQSPLADLSGGPAPPPNFHAVFLENLVKSSLINTVLERNVPLFNNISLITLITSATENTAGARSKNSAANHSTFQKTSELFSIGGGHVVPVVNNTTCFSIYKWLLFLLLFSSYFPLLSHSFLK